VFNFILKDHGISLCFPVEMDITSTNKGKWLEENNIDYKISSFEEDMAASPTNNGYDVHAVYIIECLQFCNEADMIAFKLRWC